MTLQPKFARYSRGPRRFGPELPVLDCIATMHGRAAGNEHSPLHSYLAHDVEVQNYDMVIAMEKTANTANLILLTVSVPALARASGKPYRLAIWLRHSPVPALDALWRSPEACGSAPFSLRLDGKCNIPLERTFS